MRHNFRKNRKLYKEGSELLVLPGALQRMVIMSTPVADDCWVGKGGGNTIKGGHYVTSKMAQSQNRGPRRFSRNTGGTIHRNT